RIYVFGGTDGSGTIFNTVFCYSPSANTWTQVVSMNLARLFPAATRGANGRLYVIGGLNSSFPALADFESYSPLLNSWSALSATPTARYGLAAVLGQDGRIYAFGGADAVGNPLSTNQSLATVGGGSAAPPPGKNLPPAQSSAPSLTVLSTDAA